LQQAELGAPGAVEAFRGGGTDIELQIALTQCDEPAGVVRVEVAENDPVDGEVRDPAMSSSISCRSSALESVSNTRIPSGRSTNAALLCDVESPVEGSTRKTDLLTLSSSRWPAWTPPKHRQRTEPSNSRLYMLASRKWLG